MKNCAPVWTWGWECDRFSWRSQQPNLKLNKSSHNWRRIRELSGSKLIASCLQAHYDHPREAYSTAMKNQREVLGRTPKLSLKVSRANRRVKFPQRQPHPKLFVTKLQHSNQFRGASPIALLTQETASTPKLCGQTDTCGRPRQRSS